MGYPEPDQEERDRIPETILEPLHRITWDLVSIQSTWMVIDQVFGPDDANKLLNRASAYAFQEFYEALVEKCILGLSRLGDRAMIGRHHTLSINALTSALAASGLEGLARTGAAVVDRSKAAQADLRLFRDKMLAHTDRRVALGIDSLPPIKYADIALTIEEAQSFVNCVRRHFGVQHFCFDMLIGADATGVLQSLRKLDEYRQLRGDAYHIEPDELVRRFMQIRRG